MNKKAFTLVEMIVGISISVLLMVSIGVFVNSGMKAIFLGQKSLENMSDLNYFTKDLYSTLDKIHTGSLNLTNSGVIFKRDLEFDTGGFSYIGIAEQNGFFCDDPNSEDTKTKHIFIKNFIPFFENGEDINSVYNDIIESNEVTFNSKQYKTLQKEHKVVNNLGNTIIGKGIFGNSFVEGSEATDIYLNSPTGIASDGEKLYISDTLNNRILYLSGTTIHKLLDENDGLNEPTGLFIENNNTLYISNSGNNEILKYSSENITNNSFNFSFSGITENNINNLSIEFLNTGNNHILTNSDFNLVGNDSAYDNKNIIGNTLNYTFEKPTLNASGAVIGEESDYLNFNGATTYNINLTNLSDFSSSGNYYLNLNIGASNKIIQFFTQGDNKIYTKEDNTLENIHTSETFLYPSGIDGTSISDIEQFDINTSPDLTFDPETDIILQTPVESLEITEDTTNKMLFLKLKYYTNYNCFNLDENTGRIRTFIANKNLK